MTSFIATPNDSRYVPFTQQTNCCVPTSLQMIMYRNNIPLLPAEELGYHLGLTVSPEESPLFYRVRTAPEPPSGAGYGTQIFRPEYEPNKIFAKLGIPLKFHLKLATELPNTKTLINTLKAVEDNNTDALLCFNHGVIRGRYEANSGHVVVFDRIINDQVRVVDASPRHPKWRFIESSILLDAIKRHGNENSGGIWFFEKQ